MLLGDRVAEITKQLGLKGCTPCRIRQAKLNQIDQTIRNQLSQGYQTLRTTLFASQSSSQPPDGSSTE